MRQATRALRIAAGGVLLLCSLIATSEEMASAAPGKGEAGLSAFSPEDGQLDLSQFIDQAYGFMPVIVPITEPAVGYGAFGALAFIDRPDREQGAGFGRPNVTVLGGFGTENGTRGAVAADLRRWMDDRVQTLVGVIDSSVNLDFYGTGSDGARREAPVAYNLDLKGVYAQARVRLGESRLWGGLAYARADPVASATGPTGFPNLPEFSKETHVGGLLPSLTYDSRDNLFTPTRGSFVDASVGIFDTSLGSDSDFRRSTLTAIHYLPLKPTWTLGVFAAGTVSSGDIPFYLRPFIGLRGAPAMRYQGESTAEIEGELRWQFKDRYSLVGFLGTGVAKSEFQGMSNDKNVTTGGVGMRYEIARKHGLHMGIDFAVGPDSNAIYIQFGSAWMRP